MHRIRLIYFVTKSTHLNDWGAFSSADNPEENRVVQWCKTHSHVDFSFNPSYRHLFQQILQAYLKTTSMCVKARLELNSVGLWPSRN